MLLKMAAIYIGQIWSGVLVMKKRQALLRQPNLISCSESNPERNVLSQRE